MVFIGSKANMPLGKMVLPESGQGDGLRPRDHSRLPGELFRTWAAESTAFPREIIEAALAHVVGDKSEQAYQRSDVVEKRRQLMEAWSTFVSTPSRAKTGNNVTHTQRRGVM